MNATAQLQAVSCPATGNCFVVGYYEGGETPVTLAYRWNGSWAAQRVPSPGSEAELTSVSCSSATACEAVGWYSNTVGVDLPLAERWNGTRWAWQGIPNPSAATTADLTGVSCVPSGVCTAVGYYTTNGGGSPVENALAERWNGTRWTIQPVPTPSGNGAPYLASVSCATGTTCMAVGTADGAISGGSGPPSPIAEQWTAASGWSIVSAPTVGQQDTELYGVSCSAANACIAVGNTAPGGGTLAAFDERWDGTSWTIP
jgi:hypothetical protein